MSRRLPALRHGFDIIPSPNTNQRGLLLRDLWRYSEKVIFVPPPWTVRTHGDELKWCGYSPLYTFASALPTARGRILRYEQETG